MSVPTESTIEVEIKPKTKRQASTVANDPDRFKHGVLIRGKFIGVEDVKKENGDDVCQTAMIKLKAVVLAKKEHKQRVCIKINLEGIEILDEKTNQVVFKHSVNRISYIARDSTDSRAIGYIYKNSPNNFQYFAIKTERQAQELFNTLKDLFEVVLELRKAEVKKEDETVEKLETQETPEIKQSESTSQITGVVTQMNQQPESLFDFPTNNFADSSFEKSLDTTPVPKAASNELFGVFDSSPITAPPQTQSDKYSSLLNDLSNLSTSPQRPPPVPPMPQMSPAANPFGATNMPSPFFQQTPPGPNYNPFGGFNAPMAQPNPMMGANPMMGNPMGNYAQPRYAPVPPPPQNQMFPMSLPTQPANNNSFNQTQQQNSFPW